jgi:hypothetical protein
MITSTARRRWWVVAALIAMVVPLGSAKTPDLNCGAATLGCAPRDLSLGSAKAPELNSESAKIPTQEGPAPSGSAKASVLNPAALAYKLPDQIHWNDDPMGLKSAVLFGDPSKPGLYIMLVKWTPGHMSHPHFHPNDRFITVLSGTWWVGTGSKFDPESTVPLPAGTFVTHFGKQIHYDGAKAVEAVLQIVGEGPATATPAEVK